MKNNIREVMKQFEEENHKEYVQAILSIELNIEDQDVLDVMYEDYMNNDGMTLINEEFEKM